ncbi:carbohydrate ABC transporter substrate-binding protein, CUT1 family [Tranquillimonas rosea]|uniref:Carbohydrate ABC transporter substrate-binding protein, CUT1 family n=1 Tax=Tranquillimonas rosea TaxID=641238 RepID=A0A1H9WMD3_9RHOB|nr:ABC transporter substrate-binding protein [Tranquillimonas rosea]SES34603.1 carbohydrate ABC transporter substrate-binding protein, CUT1 family [Tranquillimonas rosea]
MDFKLDRRGLLLGGSALAAATAAGLRPAFAQDGRIRLLWWGSQPRADRTFEVISLFEGSHDGATVDGETVGWSDYWTRLATQVAGRNAPDVIQMDYRYIFEYARRGALAELEEFRDSTMPLEGFNDRTLEGGSADGHLYGVSLGANSAADICNMDAFEAAGIELPATFTYDDLREFGPDLAGAADIPYATADESGYETAFENWLRQRGKALYTDEGQLGFSQEDAQDWYELWAGLREDGICVPPDIQALDQRQVETNMLTLGHAAMAVAHTNQLVAYQSLNPATLEMRPLPLISPDATGGHYRKPSMFFSVAKGSENKELATTFINYFVTNPEAAKVLDVERGVPESPEMREVIEPMLDEAGQAAIAFIEDLGELAGPLPPPPPKGTGEIQTLMIRLGQEVGFGQRSISEGAEQLVSEASSILERA